MCGGRFKFSDGRVVDLPEAVLDHTGPGIATVVEAWAMTDDGQPFVRIRARFPVELHPGDTLACNVVCPTSASPQQT